LHLTFNLSITIKTRQFIPPLPRHLCIRELPQ